MNVPNQCLIHMHNNSLDRYVFTNKVNLQKFEQTLIQKKLIADMITANFRPAVLASCSNVEKNAQAKLLATTPNSSRK